MKQKYSKEIEELINGIVDDDVLTEKEEKVLRAKAKRAGLDPDELVEYVEERIATQPTKKEREDRKMLYELFSVFAVIFIFCGVMILIERKDSHPKEVVTELTLTNPKPFKYRQIDKCIGAIEACIQEKQLGNAEYYVRSFESTDEIKDAIAHLTQCYIENNLIDKAVDLAQWAIHSTVSYKKGEVESAVYSPIYDYYFMAEEYAIAAQYLPSNTHSAYLNHLEKVINRCMSEGKRDEAIKNINAGIVFFYDVDANDKSFSPKSVKSKLMAIVDSY